MIGKTNLPLGGDKGENVNISLTTNQTDSSDIIGAVITVTYAGESTQYSWDGQTITVNIPSNEAYSVAFSTMNNYATPATFSATSVKGNSRTVTAEYKTCVVAINITDNQSSYNDIASAKATITGSASGTLSNGGTIKVPWGGTITATGSAVTGYNTPTGTATADAVSKTLTLTYATEILTLKMATDGATPTGFKLTIKNSAGTTLATQTSTTGTHKIPYGTNYYVTASAVTDFTAPSNSSTYTASSASNASRTITMTYKEIKKETLTVTVSGISSGFTIYVKTSSGSTIGSQTTTSKTYNIAAGTKYYVTASSVDGYVAPSNSSTHTAVANSTHSVSMPYVYHGGTKNPSNGVYIKDTYGFYLTSSEWTGAFPAYSVAVVTNNRTIQIALHDAYASRMSWGTCVYEEDGVTIASSLSSAKSDYNGYENTDAILSNEYNNDYNSAAYMCRQYGGYLGAAGEWSIVNDNLAGVQAALSKCGGDELNRNFPYWTSTQYDFTNRVWNCYLGIEMDWTYVTYDYYVRAFY